MKIFIYAAMLAIAGCGVVPQERLEPVGGTRDLVSKEQRLYVQEVGDDQHCVLMESKAGKSTVLLTKSGALIELQLRSLIGDMSDWAVFMYALSLFSAADEIERQVREDRLAALHVRDTNMALTPARFKAIVAGIRKANPVPDASSCEEFDPALN